MSDKKNGKARKAERKASNAKSDAIGKQQEPVQVEQPKVEKPKSEAKAKQPANGMPALPKLPSSARSRKPRPTQPCACGCGTTTTGQWAPGHDARARGWAIRIERGIVKIHDVPANEQDGAKLMLKIRKETGVDKDNKIKLIKPEAEAEQAPAAVNE